MLTLYSHRVGPGGEASFELSIPAQEDPKFADLPHINYMSTKPEDRAFLLYHLPNMSPLVAALDIALRETVPLGDLEDVIPSLMEPPDIRVPTLIVNGDFDIIACDTPCTETDWLVDETSLYPPEACAELAIIPDAGHALTLSRNAPEFFAVVREWSDRRVGASTKKPAPEPCEP